MGIIDVTCAVVIRDKCVLACLREPKSEHGNQWEFPGGKIELGESPVTCIVREMYEELNVRVKVVFELESVIHVYSHTTIRLIPFLCEIESGSLMANEHAEIRWLPFDQFDRLNWSMADRKLFEINRNRILC